MKNIVVISQQNLKLACPHFDPNSKDLSLHLKIHKPDLAIVNIFTGSHPGSIAESAQCVADMRSQGFKGFIIGTSTQSINDAKFKRIFEKSFNRFIPFHNYEDTNKRKVFTEVVSEISEQLQKIPPYFSIGKTSLNREGFEKEILPAGKYIHSQFATVFFNHHPQAQLAYVSDDQKVIEYTFEEEKDGNNEKLFSLMNENNKYIFSFKRSELFPENNSLAA